MNEMIDFETIEFCLTVHTHIDTVLCVVHYLLFSVRDAMKKINDTVEWVFFVHAIFEEGFFRTCIFRGFEFVLHMNSYICDFL